MFCSISREAREYITRCFVYRRFSKVSLNFRSYSFYTFAIYIRIYREKTAIRSRFRDLNPFLRVGTAREANKPGRRAPRTNQTTSYFNRNCPPADWMDDIQPPVVAEFGKRRGETVSTSSVLAWLGRYRIEGESDE